ncbi:sphingomyelin phosphodiesterase-like [Onthophagus taurus]|uniref:sphingomyelin phosphodiesterase-like n=1 Tax=Onthophagus taurus TaxID=166361 RepID=UPI000C1FDD3B|nr:sphingomyelin phosphodiesterase-like [Onthophagus taurus]
MFHLKKFVLVFCVLNHINGRVINFEDPWSYEIPPHNDPLLNEGGSNHILPPMKEHKAKSFVRLINANRVDMSKEYGNSVREKLSCSTCRIGTMLLQGAILDGSSFEEIRTQFVSICTSLNIENEIVCTGLFNTFAPDFLPALNLTEISVEQICSLTVGELCGDIENPLHEWDIKLPDKPKPQLQLAELPLKDSPTFKVLHLTDVHYDPNYVQGSPANCDEPMCCHVYSTVEDDERVIEPAGKWGSYSKCDMPKIFIESMLKHIAEQHPDIDYILWTGDLPPHDIWNQTKMGNLKIIQESVEQMLRYFPETPIFPAVGNHESSPAGSFPPPWMTNQNNSISYLYDTLSVNWRKWLPSSINSTVIHGAFYSVLLRPGFRLISVNSNYCISLSWFLVVNSTDPAQELKWLVYELEQAENAGEKVHIIGHIPPGDSDCLKVWSRNFYKIIDRFEDTVKAQFYGHTHSDQFEVFYDTTSFKRATNIAFIAPSVTTFEHHNPGYRIYYVDGDHERTTREVIDHETWITNLEDANSDESEPIWKKLYTARSAYNLESLRPQDWSDLIDKMVDNPGVFNLYYKHYYKDSPVKPPCDDNKCKLLLLCDLRSGKSHDRHHLCRDLEEKLRE